MPRSSAKATNTDEVRPELPPRLAEFRTALEEEIKAARSDRTNFVHLMNGHFVARVGGVFHYEFETSGPVRVPPDTPGELTTADRSAPIAVTVMEAADLKVTIAARVHLGHILSKAELRADLTMLLQRLVERIEQKAGETWPVAERILDGGPVSGTVPNFRCSDNLSQDQAQAVASALGRDLTFIWGPPGTGKTQTIGSIGKELFGRQRTLLLVSHTNVAVDEALLRIAQLCDGRFAEGEIIRLGEPVKSELLERKDLIARDVAARRTRALETQRDQLKVERQAAMSELSDLERLVAVVEWAEDGSGDVRELRSAVSSLRAAEAERSESDAELSRMSSEKHAWEAKRRGAAEVALTLDALSAAVQRKREMVPRAGRLKGEVLDLLFGLRNAKRILRRAQRAEPLRTRRAALGPMATLADALEECHGTAQNCAADLAARQQLAAEAQTLLDHSLATNRISRLFRGLPSPDEQRRVVAQCAADIGRSEQALAEAGDAYQVANLRIQEAGELDVSLRDFEGVPNLATQTAICQPLEAKIADLRSRFDECCDELHKIRSFINANERNVTTFERVHGVGAEDLLRQTDDFQARLSELTDRGANLRLTIGRTRRETEAKMLRLLATLREFRLTQATDDSIPNMMSAIVEAYAEAGRIARENPGDALARRRDQLDARVNQIDSEIDAIDDQLERVEHDLIFNARIVATTLTRAFMRQVLQERRFDTILCDEASMAPIPALWAAATLATHSAVIVGDFHQLPPIVQSEHSVARRWLGRDIFEASKVRALYEKKKPPPFFVPLSWQHRMHPQISDAPNKLIYKGLLNDHEDVTAPTADDDLHRWYAAHRELDRPLLLVDTSKMGGWNNKAGKSRMNLLSASLSVRLAVACLRESRPKWEKQRGSRVLIITPYRPQAALITHLLRAEGIPNDEVQASTAHSCQGGQADMVLIDLVVDRPHHVTTLTTTAADGDTRRLLNVAMTRARRRLILLGNFGWLRLKGSGAFVGGELLPYLTRKHRPLAGLQAWSFLAGLATREQVARSMDVEEELSTAAAAARQKLVIFSPAVSTDCLQRVAPLLQSAAARNVETLIVTRPLHEEGASRAAERVKLEESLAHLRAGRVTVIHKSKMEEKLILADETTLWTATFPPLADPPDDGWLERRELTMANRSLPLYEDLSQCLGLEHLFGAVHEHQLHCPICSSELWIADAGRTTDQPFFWKCSRTGCRWRRYLHEPAVVAGVIVFSKCTGRPGLDYRGDVPVWICDCGHKHRTQVRDRHVMLPRMWALVPSQRRNRLLRVLELTPDDLLQQGDLGM